MCENTYLHLLSLCTNTRIDNCMKRSLTKPNFDTSFNGSLCFQTAKSEVFCVPFVVTTEVQSIVPDLKADASQRVTRSTRHSLV